MQNALKIFFIVTPLYALTYVFLLAPLFNAFRSDLLSGLAFLSMVVSAVSVHVLAVLFFIGLIRRKSFFTKNIITKLLFIVNFVAVLAVFFWLLNPCNNYFAICENKNVLEVPDDIKNFKL